MRMASRRLALSTLAMVLAVPVSASSFPGAVDAAAQEAPVADPTPQVGGQSAQDSSPEAKAMAAARRTGRRVELSGLRTETGQVFANPDGTKTMEQHAQPVRVRRGAGWVTPDATLRRLPDGTVRPVATVTPIVLSGGGSSALLSIGRPGARVHLGWLSRLPAPRLRGDTATYAEVMPGVDLQIRVGVDNFSHVLVVKNRAAASNPALRTLRYPIRGDGLTVTVKRDGSMVAADRAGKAVYRAPAPTMWDTPATPAAARRASDSSPRLTRIGIRTSGTGAGRSLVLTPDLRMLSDPAARFPLYIDPPLTGNLLGWLHVNPVMGDQSAWSYDRNDEGAKVGRAYGAPANLYRSMFLMSTVNGPATIAGSTIVSAYFKITLNKTPSGTKTPVQLWHLNDLDPDVRVDWGNQEGYWRGALDSRDGEAYPWTEDNGMEFTSPGLHEVIQWVATFRKTSVSLGLRAADENNQWQWKKFHPHTAVLSITYNTAPRIPKSLNFTRPRPCGTATAPTPIATATPQFSAVGNDPDPGDNITTTLQILDGSGAVAHESKVGPTVTGAAFSWPETPTGKLSEGVVYRYRSFTSDAVTSGPTTPDCYFVVDSVKPRVPRIQSADYPDGEPAEGRYERTLGTVSFSPAAGDTDVAEYVYGFQKERMTLRVKAGQGGSATIPVTVWRDPISQVPSARLYVRAVDHAGNVSPESPAWGLETLASDTPVAHVRGDTNGDGKADVTAVFDHGYGRTAIWNVTSNGTGFQTGVMAWDTGEGGGFALSRTKPVQGDFDNDGRTDMAMFREGAGRQIWLYKLMSDGNRYTAPPAVWTSAPNAWALSTARMVSGDVDGDKKADIVVQNAGASDNWQALVFRAADNFTQPKTWAQAAGGNPWSQSAPLLADVDGDGKSDLLSMRNLTGCRTVVDLYRSTGAGFAAATPIYDSGAGNYCWERSKPTVADADGDGRDDIVALYEYAAGDAGLTVFRSSGVALTPSSWWRRSGELDLSKATLAAGDFDGNVDGDRREDVAIVYADGQVGDRLVYTFRSTGTSFGDKVLGWGGPVGAVAGPKFDIEHRQYELVNRNSGRCLNVLNGSVANEAAYVQAQCQPADLDARYQLEAIAGTDQYALRPAHTAVAGGPTKCADVDDWSMNDGGKVIQWLCGNGNGEPTANQQVTIGYVDGSSYDTVVQLRFAHSGKCMAVEGARLDDNAPIEQQSCGQASNQQWILRPAYNGTQLGEGGAARYRTEAATSATQILDVENCENFDGGNIRMWDEVPGSACQGWKLESLGDDVYKIIDPNSGKAIDIQGCSKLPEGVIHIWASNDTECQKWRIEPLPGGSYRVIAVSSGLSLDVKHCSSAKGADVITWFYHGGLCQRWFFKRR